MSRVLCLLAVGVAGVVCGWVWSQVDVLVAASVAGHSGAAWLRACIGVGVCAAGVAVVGLTADRRSDR